MERKLGQSTPLNVLNVSPFSGQIDQVNPAVTLTCGKKTLGNPPQYCSKCYESPFSGQIGQVNPAVTIICGKKS